MSLYRWSLGVVQLGALLLAVGLVPQFVLGLFGAQSMFTVLLQLGLAPLGALVLAIGLVMLLLALVRNRRRG